jgi:hypothetical protein
VGRIWRVFPDRRQFVEYTFHRIKDIDWNFFFRKGVGMDLTTFISMGRPRAASQLHLPPDILYNADDARVRRGVINLCIERVKRNKKIKKPAQCRAGFFIRRHRNDRPGKYGGLHHIPFTGYGAKASG